jgi:hypothetical protein
MDYKTDRKIYKIGDTIRILIYTGSENYYEIQNNELIYVANVTPESVTPEEYYLTDPFDNFAIQIISNKTEAVIAYKELPNFRRENTFYWTRDFFNFGREYPKYATHSDFQFKITKDYLTEYNEVIFDLRLVSYKNASELEEPIYTDVFRVQEHIAFSQIIFIKKNNFLTFSN